MKKVTGPILQFCDFLNLCWTSMRQFIPPSNSIINQQEGDWLQANWEILLENSICAPGQFLKIYADGADCYEDYSRITYYNKAATHKIIGVLDRDPIYDYYNQEVIETLSGYSFHQFVGAEQNERNSKMAFLFSEFEHDKLDKVVWIKKEEVQYFLAPI